jgi:hypothetical protein
MFAVVAAAKTAHSNASKLSEEEKLGYPVNCKITWSLLTVSYDKKDHDGDGLFFAQGFFNAERRKQWVTLIDK